MLVRCNIDYSLGSSDRPIRLGDILVSLHHDECFTYLLYGQRIVRAPTFAFNDAFFECIAKGATVDERMCEIWRAMASENIA